MSSSVMDFPTIEVKGIGKQKAEDMKSLGIETIGDLIEYFPFRYEDYRIKDLSQVQDGERITLQGVLYGAPSSSYFGKRKSRLACKVVVDHLIVTAIWFNQNFLQTKLTAGREVVLTGKWDRKRLQMTVSETQFSDAPRGEAVGTLQPVYSVGGPISLKWIRKAIRQALDQYGQAMEELLPSVLVQKYKLISRKQAIHLMHYPEDGETGKQARRRMAYEELFLFQLKLQAFRMLHRKKGSGIAHQFDEGLLKAFLALLPFTLTDEQVRVMHEILKDMRAPMAMNRLVQGDVGSGKTVVAAIAMYASYLSGHQSAFMVPTEILAEQHAETLHRFFESLGIEVALLKGSLTARQRRDLIAQLRMGMIDIVVGTHALIQEGVDFKNLGLVITDEQHRFGVQQRGVLRQKGIHPDVLFMTATPIPRTLAITAYGDMDVSSIRALPQGRKPIETYWVKHNTFDRVIDFVAKQLDLGRQAYVICPLIEESEKLDVQNAIDTFHQLTQALPSYKVGLMHGRLHPDEKDKVMRDFSQNAIQLLVSTTVVEVGVNVPNAALMVIMDAERFGLAQLHQLRGRVGRAEHQSYCILIGDPKTEVGKERMQVMTETNDGFEIARRDLELRGPGDFFGKKQSGLPEFKVADLSSDVRILECARDDAAELIKRESFWVDAEYQSLRDVLVRDRVVGGTKLD
jgi:ATP-dependent DNA helicase RecG